MTQPQVTIGGKMLMISFFLNTNSENNQAYLVGRWHPDIGGAVLTQQNTQQTEPTDGLIYAYEHRDGFIHVYDFGRDHAGILPPEVAQNHYEIVHDLILPETRRIDPERYQRIRPHGNGPAPAIRQFHHLPDFPLHPNQGNISRWIRQEMNTRRSLQH